MKSVLYRYCFYIITSLTAYSLFGAGEARAITEEEIVDCYARLLQRERRHVSQQGVGSDFMPTGAAAHEAWIGFKRHRHSFMAHRLTPSERRAALSLSKKHRVVALRSSLFPDQTLYHVHPRSKKGSAGRFTLGEGAYQTQTKFDVLEEALHHMGLADVVKREQEGMCGWFLGTAAAALAVTVNGVGHVVVSGARSYTRLFAHPAGRLLIMGMGSGAAATTDKEDALALAPPSSLLEVGARLPEGGGARCVVP